SIAKWQGTGWTEARFDQCTAHVKQATCAFTNPLGSDPCANPPGSLPDGASCFDNSQCATGFCNRVTVPGATVPPNCGTCRAGGCLPGCKANEVCFASSAGGRCVEMQPEGTACTPASLCAPGLSCLDSVCAKSRGEGEPCTAFANCDVQQ